MFLVQILLPLRDAKGRGFPEAKYDAVAHELTERFGGVTAYTRTPAEGRWKPGGEAASQEDVVVVEVMVTALDPKWWRGYRKTLERSFQQRSIIIRAQDIQLL
jgi:hypothetical protein